MNICVYCASSSAIDPGFHRVSEELGELLAEQGHTLIYGGGAVGLMGSLARSVHEHGGRVIGYIPKALQEIEGRAYEIADELHLTDTMQVRKHGMFTRADGFIVLPGGIGTLEEFFEVMTLRKLGYHRKPIVVLNHERFFDPLLALLQHLETSKFSANVLDSDLFFVAESAGQAVGQLLQRVDDV